LYEFFSGSEPGPDTQPVRQDPEKKNIDKTVEHSNKGQAFCFIEGEAHDKSYKAGIEDFLKSAVPGVH
jgi:hypothetical protein